MAHLFVIFATMKAFKQLHLYHPLSYCYNRSFLIEQKQNKIQEVLTEFLLGSSLNQNEYVAILSKINEDGLKENWDFYTKEQAGIITKKEKEFCLPVGNYLFLQEETNQFLPYDMVKKDSQNAALWFSLECVGCPIMRILTEDNNIQFQWFVSCKPIEKLF